MARKQAIKQTRGDGTRWMAAQIVAVAARMPGGCSAARKKNALGEPFVDQVEQGRRRRLGRRCRHPGRG